MLSYSVIDEQTIYRLPARFDLQEYFRAEEELFALFPQDLNGQHHAAVLAFGMCHLLLEEREGNGELQADETYHLLADSPGVLRMARMRVIRRLTQDEIRLVMPTNVRMAKPFVAISGELTQLRQAMISEEVEEEVRQVLM